MVYLRKYQLSFLVLNPFRDFFSATMKLMLKKVEIIAIHYIVDYVLKIAIGPQLWSRVLL